MIPEEYIGGTVIHGLGNGRKLGFPTANIAIDTPPELEKGVYAVWVKVDSQRRMGMLYVGTRPTLDLQQLTYEIHLFGFRKSLYGKSISFRILRKIRNEQRFESVEKLIAAMQQDKEHIQALLHSPTHRLARTRDLNDIMDIIRQAQNRMRERHLDQWQDGYPDEAAILQDIARHQGHLFLKAPHPAAYAAIVYEPDPYYAHIEGQWLSDGETYITVHRLAIHNDYLGLGYAHHILQYAERTAAHKGVRWFRIDTHHDNLTMRNLVRDAGFTFCGIVQVRDGKRMAYEKRIGEGIPDKSGISR